MTNGRILFSVNNKNKVEKKMLNITNIINDMYFEDERFESIVKGYDIHNPYHIELLIQECKKEEVFSEN